MRGFARRILAFVAHNHRAISATFFLACVIASGYLLANPRTPRYTSGYPDEFSVGSLAKYNEAHGDTATVAFVKSNTKQFNNPQQHLIAHALGEALYRTETPAQVIAACGGLYEFGCAHQVFGMLVHERGVSSIEALAKECKTFKNIEYGDCLHAIGHGLVNVHGYDQEDIQPSLDACDRIQDRTNRIQFLKSCYGGVYMEYLMRYLLIGTKLEPRPLTGDDPYAPCDAQPFSKAKRVCAFWLLPWMHSQYNFAFNEATFAKLGTFCRTTQDADIKDPCLMSLGREAAITNQFDVPKIQSLCMAGSTMGPEFDNCIIGASRVLQEMERPADVKAACSLISKDRQAYCVSNSVRTLVAE